jgi:hypothetical protein
MSQVPDMPVCSYICYPAGLLWSLAPRLAFFLIFYAMGGTWITAAGFGQRLMALTYSVLQREADLRFSLVRLPGAATLRWVALLNQGRLTLWHQPITTLAVLLQPPACLPHLAMLLLSAGAGAGECRVDCFLQWRPAGG